jgi:hypothetical protein
MQLKRKGGRGMLSTGFDRLNFGNDVQKQQLKIAE